MNEALDLDSACTQGTDTNSVCVNGQVTGRGEAGTVHTREACRWTIRCLVFTESNLKRRGRGVESSELEKKKKTEGRIILVCVIEF